jgi:chromosome segregation ATPase
MFAAVIGGSRAHITDANVRDLSELRDKFQFSKRAKMVRDWQVERSLIDPVIHRELDRVQAVLEERLQLQDRTIMMVSQALHQQQEAAISDTNRLVAVEKDMSQLHSAIGEIVASEQKTAREIDQVRDAAAEQRRVHGHDIDAVKGEIRGLRAVMADTRRWLAEEQSQWNAAIDHFGTNVKRGWQESSVDVTMISKLEAKIASAKAVAAEAKQESSETLGLFSRDLKSDLRCLKHEVKKLKRRGFSERF